MGVEIAQKLYRILRKEPLELSLSNYPVSPRANPVLVRSMIAKELAILRDSRIIEIREGKAHLLASDEEFERFLEVYKERLHRRRKRRYARPAPHTEFWENWNYGEMWGR